MPIRFVCEHCQQRLSVSSRKAGQEATCPKCQGRILVPAQPRATEASEEEDRQPLASESEDPFAQFAVYDQQPQWVYDRGGGQSERPVDADKLAVPRKILYLQGVLLAAVALTCFLIGVLVGGSLFSPATAQNAGPLPCFIRGKVEYNFQGNQVLPDQGTVVIVVPQDQKPDRHTKQQIDGLNPEDTPVDEDHPAIVALRTLGGDYARVDARGEYLLQVPDVGEYFILFVSRNSHRDEDEALNRAELSQMGSYFAAAMDVVGDQNYRWKRASIKRDERVDILF